MKGFGMPSRECAEATKNVSAMAKAHMNFIPGDKGRKPQRRR
jgi:hypothetical protein